jgi:hypothetical protein
MEIAMSREICFVLAAVVFFRGGWMYGSDRVGGHSPEPSVERIAALIDNLDDPAFANRQEATEELESAGSAALAHLETTAAAGSREAATRAMAILKQHFQSGDAELKASTRTALERLAEHNDPSTAQRARDIVRPPRPVVATSRFGAPVIVPPPPLNVNNFRRITVSDVNGRKSVEIDDRERRVKIEAPADGNIEVEVTDKQNPAAAVRRFEAKDAVELARKDPEMGRLFDQHLRLRGQAGAGVPPLEARFGQGPSATIKAGDAARLQLESIDALLNRYRQRAQTDPMAQRMVDSLEQTRSRVQAIAR